MLHDRVERLIVAREPFLWINEGRLPLQRLLAQSQFNLADVQAAEHRLNRYAPVLAELFPETAESQGIIESPLLPVREIHRRLLPADLRTGRWLIKADHSLPVAGSIKARGGIYEVLVHAEDLAHRSGLLDPQADLKTLTSPSARDFFRGHAVAVGSTGNLGMSIGIMAAALGFRATVHMSADAKNWKKKLLKRHGVEVVRHDGDFGTAVAAGRMQAAGDELTYFVDDENSAHLFFGYSVAALRLRKQLAAQGVAVDAQHPLFVYLPCGVGGAPGGICFGLRHIFGDNVHCFFAEPTAAPCMLVRLASGADRPVDVSEFGLDNRTEADGLAVGRASEFAASLLRPLVSGIFTVPDRHLFEDLYCLKEYEGLRVEPSSAAAFRGPEWLLTSEAGRGYLKKHELCNSLDRATHVLWTTGGLLMPDVEYSRFYARGQKLKSPLGI